MLGARVSRAVMLSASLSATRFWRIPPVGRVGLLAQEGRALRNVRLVLGVKQCFQLCNGRPMLQRDRLRPHQLHYFGNDLCAHQFAHCFVSPDIVSGTLDSWDGERAALAILPQRVKAQTNPAS